MKRFFIPLAALFSLVAPELTRAAPPIYPGVVPYEQLDTRNFYLGNYPILRIMPFMPKDTPPYLPVDTWSFAINTNLWTLYAYDPPNTTWHQVLGLGGIAVTINPTDTVMPYRVDATTFGDSPWSVPGAGQAYADGANAFLHLDLATGNSSYHTTTPNSTLAIYPQMLMEQVPAMGDTVSTTTMAEGMLVSNPTPSTAAAPENSPSMYWGGSAWSTNGAASTPMAFAAVGVPRNAANIPTAYWSLFSSVSNRPPTLEFTVKEGSGYTGLGTSYLSDAGTYTSNLTTWSTYLMYSTITNLITYNLSIVQGGVTNTVGSMNPTDRYLPYRQNSTNFGDSPLIRYGTNTYGSSSSRITNTVSISSGDFQQRASMDNVADVYFLRSNTNQTLMSFTQPGNSSMGFNITPTDGFITLQLGGVTGFALEPSVADGVTPYVLNTTINHTSGDLISLQTGGNDRFKVSAVSGWTGTGSKVLTDNGTYQTVGAAGGTNTLWTNYVSTTDMEGGAVYGMYSLNALTNAAMNQAVNNLPAFWGDNSTITFLGMNENNTMQLAEGNANIAALGDWCGWTTTFTNSGSITMLGDAALQQSTVTNSFDIFALGFWPGKASGYTNSLKLYMVGSAAGANSTWTEATNVYAWGSSSMNLTTYTNVSNIYAWGLQSLETAQLSNSTNVYAYGHLPGYGLIGDGYSDIYLFGTAQPTRKTNEFVFGSTNDLYTFPGTKAAFGYDAAVTNRAIVGTQTNPTNSVGSIGMNYGNFGGIIDPIMEVGINVTNANRLVAGAPAVWMGLEQNYQNGGQYYSEAYFSSLGVSGGTAYRPFAATWSVADPTTYANVGISVSTGQGFTVSRNSDNAALFTFGGDGRLTVPGNIYLSTATSYMFTAAGGKIRIGAAPTYPLDVITASGLSQSRVKASGASATDHANLLLWANGGNPYVAYILDAGTYWSSGTDHVNSDRYAIASTNFLGTIYDRLVILTNGNVGIATPSPTSTLQVAGSFAESIATGSAVTLGATNDIYLCNVDAQLVTLPTAVGCRGRNYTVKLIAPATTGTVTNFTGAQLIDGALSYSLTASNKFLRVVSDNANWWIIGNN